MVAKEKEAARLDLVRAAKRLARVAKEKEATRLDLLEAAKRLAMVAKEKEAVIEQSPIAIEIYSQEGLLLQANKVCLEMFGVVNINEISLFPLFDDPNINSKYKDDLRLGKNVRFESLFDFDKVKELNLYHTTKSGQLWLDISIASIKDNDGTMNGYLVQIQDISENKRLYEELHKAALYSRTLIEASIDPLVTIDKDGKITDVNIATEIITGINRKKIIGTDFCDYFTKPKKAKTGYRKVFEQEKIIDYPLSIRHKSGKIRDVLYNASVFKDNQGKVIGVFASARDITKLKLEESERKRSEELFKKLFTEAPMGIALIDSSTGEIHEANPMFARIAGRTIKELIQIDWMSITHPDDIKKELDNMVLLNAGKIGGFQMEKRFLHRDGSFVWINMTISSMAVEDKKYPRHFCMVEDITERKNERMILQESENLSASIIKSIPGTFYMLDSKGKYVRWNDYQRNEIVGKGDGIKDTNAIDTIHPDDRELIGAKIANVLRGGSTEIVEGRVLLRGGPEFKWLIMTGNRLISKDKVYLVGIGIDISAIKTAEEKLKELDRLKDDFLSVTTHELKTPLIPIKSQSQMLLAGDYGEINSMQKKAVEMIYRNEETLSMLTGEILDIAKIKSNKFNIVLKKITLDRIISEVIDDINSFAREKQITISVMSLSQIPAMMVDGLRITQVMKNLLDNAIKFTPENGKIDVEIKTLNKEVIVRVKDTGIGIVSENLKKLFTPFFQIDSKLGRRYRGTGLGLAVSKGIIEAHGGRIWVESKGDGKGSSFYFSLPL